MTSRDRILDGAATVMREQGLARATTKEIARAAGVSEALLYKVFSDKTDIFLGVLTERLPRVVLFDADPRELMANGSVIENLERIAGDLVSFYGATFPIAASVFSDQALLERHRTALAERNAGPQKVTAAVVTYLRAELKAARLTAGLDVDSIAALLVGACFHQAFLLSFDQRPPTAASARHFARKTVSALRPALE